MERRTYVLIADGSSDRCLLPIIDYWLRQYFPTIIFKGESADFSLTRTKGLPDKLREVIDLYEPDWIFMHRDAEKAEDPIRLRSEEITEACRIVNPNQTVISVIPIRMTEAWLLIDESAIRRAAGNPNGTIRLDLPRIHQIEKLSNPKELLFDLLRKASGLSGRKLQNLNVHKARYLVAEHIQDFEILGQLGAFRHFQDQLRASR